MIYQAFIGFIEQFEKLSPFELDHFCKIIHHHYETAIKALDQDARASLTHGDTKEILIRSMQAAQIELAEHKLKEAELNVQLIKAKVYKD